MTHTDPTAAVARALALPDIACPVAIAAHLGIHVRTVRRYLREGTLPGRRIGRRWYTDRRELLDAVRSRPALRAVGAEGAR